MKKIIFFASIILICIIILLLILRKKSTTNIQKNSPFPTNIPLQESNKQVDKNLSNLSNPSNLPQVDLGKGPEEFNPVIEFLNIFLNFGKGVESSIQNLPTGQANPPSTSNSQSSNFTYFAQCNGYGKTALPSGCNLCKAGCGPTTVAMITASYLGSNYNPKTIIDLYQDRGYLLGCNGSRYSDAKNIFQELGLKTTDYLIFNAEKSGTVASELRKYVNAGWTFFALANFRDNGGSHYFWITDIDSQGNIWAYDPYYGRYEIPYNENSRYPYPLYRLAFGVKK